MAEAVELNEKYAQLDGANIERDERMTDLLVKVQSCADAGFFRK